jgi:drug/metabolite transporter (DMT)-like permease
MWLLYSLLSAFSVATSDALTKRALMQARQSEWLIGWVRLAYAVPFLLMGLWFVPVPQLDARFWIAVAIMLPLEVGSYILYVRAIGSSPLSLTLPLLAFTPLFLIVTSYLILGEKPTRLGLVGIALISGGSYLLNVHEIRSGWLGPLRSLAREPGARAMLVVALVYSVTSVLGKVGLQCSSPAFFAIFYFVLLAAVFTPLSLLKARPAPRDLVSQPIRFVLIGFFYFSMILFHYLALERVAVPYMISVKRTSMVFSVLYGWAFFREPHIRQRLAGCACMLAGAAIIAFA